MNNREFAIVVVTCISCLLLGVYWGWHADLSEEFIVSVTRLCEPHGGVVAMDQTGADCRDGARFDTVTIRKGSR